MSPISDLPTASTRIARSWLTAVARTATEVPARLRSALPGADRIANADAITERLDDLEHRVLLLGDTIAVLSRGLEQLPSGEIDDRRRADAAQQAHRILIAEHLTTGSAPQ
ncbi:hypothetical protein [Nocardia sp. CY41]|uniref:hypothetical protein n=1 Tax=Nocardia sp. CY41 TaxID=2608686 RepID=UPI0013581730|nr:hypothetical protein [Nocardia sp. CY41]